MDHRSTTLSTRLNDELRDIRLVDVDLRGLTGSSIVGRRVRLDFITKLAFTGEDSLAKAHPMFDLCGEVTVCKEHGAPPRPLGRLHLREPAFVPSNLGDLRSWTPQHIPLRLELDQRQMDEIEELRAGGGLGFWINLEGVVHVHGVVSKLNPSSGQLFYEVGQSDWIKLLNQMQYGRYMTIEVPLPQAGELGGELATAAEALHEATDAFRRGEDEETVADCRDALEALIRWEGGKPQAQFGDQSLTKDERFIYAQVALQKVAHLAHHPRDKTATGGLPRVPWNRADAEAIIAIVAALIRRAAGRP